MTRTSFLGRGTKLEFVIVADAYNGTAEGLDGAAGLVTADENFVIVWGKKEGEELWGVVSSEATKRQRGVLLR